MRIVYPTQRPDGPLFGIGRRSGRALQRLTVVEPFSGFALWSPRLAWFGGVVTAIGVALLRFGKVETSAGFAVIGAGLFLVLAAIALAVAAFVAIWAEGQRGAGSAVWGFVLALLILAWPAMLGIKAVTLPQLNDVTTDIDSPPEFSRSRVALAARGGFIPPELAPERRAAQAAAYPLVAPLYLDVAPGQAYETVRSAAEGLGWQIVEGQKPGGRMGQGRLEAIAHTPLLNLPEDVTVRIRATADGTRIDVRSVSRFGAHDLGTNADRVQTFLDAVSEEVAEDAS
ncbi:DUF1499 domain-containing protein [Chelatococcus reniformis]|uniref:DUF1499 domain-containing protein n=1 Tax=Chelatococcus reniformis TaxID=1494448 RepID=A0A916U5B6_9HYPH|nr:DUF1499 domain-containing protein [Chelatococcus reniformis]GGC60521.1 hypothetical protein GCM10010994_18960 [Chelatococcus reniformis]